MMKKTLLASLLALSFAGSANAAFVPEKSLTLPVGEGVVLGNFTGGGSPLFWEIVGGYEDLETFISYNFSFAPANTAIAWDIFEDSDSALNSVELGGQLGSGLIGGQGNPLSVSYTFLANTQYVLKFSTDAGIASANLSSVPVPAAAWLFGSALFGAGALRRKQKTA